MKIRYASWCAMVAGGVLLASAIGCSGSSQATTAPESDKLAVADFEDGGTGSEEVLIQVEADCKVDVEEAHISESKKQEALWQLNGDPGPLVIEFKEQKGRDALEVTSPNATSARGRIKLAKQQGRHPYRIKIGEKECPDPSIIIDG